MDKTPADSIAAPSGDAPLALHNRRFDEIGLGDSAAISRRLRAEDVQLLSMLYGGGAPATPVPAPGDGRTHDSTSGHGEWVATLIHTVLDTHLPGAGTVCIEQSLRFLAPVDVGDTLTASVQLIARDAATQRLRFACRCVNQHGAVVIDGVVEVLAPVQRIVRPRTRLPQITAFAGNGDSLFARAHRLGAIRVGVGPPL
jgi:hypothetical protein